MKTTEKLRHELLDYLLISLGAAVYAISVDFFTAANDIAPGGVTGIAAMLNHLLMVPIGTVSLILNIPLLIWGAIENGRRFLIKTIAATASAAVFIDLFSVIPYHYEGDRILSAVFGGLIGGSGLGLIFLRGGTTGGTDIIARNIHKRMSHISVGSIILISDAVVVSVSAVVYGSIENALYAVIALFVSTKVIDGVVYGFARDNGKLLIIVTRQPDELCAEILSRGHRGVTVLNAVGGYTKNKEGVLLCAVRPSEVQRIRGIISEIDAGSFIITTVATTIAGEGFRPEYP